MAVEEEGAEGVGETEGVVGGVLVAVAVVVGVVEEGALREATEVVEQGGAEAEATWAVAAKVMV